jgi:uncharacterized BrkB/YihY/UPF0761 family membrane protein
VICAVSKKSFNLTWNQKKLSRFMKRILGSIWVLALLLAIPVIVFLPPLFDKYAVKIENSRIYRNSNIANILFEDITASTNGVYSAEPQSVWDGQSSATVWYDSRIGGTRQIYFFKLAESGIFY